MNSDADLLRQYVELHANSAFTALVQTHLRLVYSTALRRVGGDTHLAEDVTQTVFVALARKAPSLLGHPSLAGWLYSTTLLASADAVRREQRRKRRETQVAMTPSDALPADPNWEQLRPVLDDALAELGATDREAVLLRFFQQRTFAEVGTALRTTEEAARKRVDRALEKLRQQLLRRGVTSTVAILAVGLSIAGSVAVPSYLAQAVGEGALTHAAATAAGSASVASLALPVAAVIALGGFLIAHQHATNAQLRESVARQQAVARDVSRLRSENDALARRLADLDALRVAQGQRRNEPSETKTTPAPVPVVAVKVNLNGTLFWDSKPVTLATFMRRLQASAASNGSSVAIKAEGAQFGALAYAIDQAARAGIDHVTVQSSTKPEVDVGHSWF